MAEKLGDAYVEISTRDTKLAAGLGKAQKDVGASMKAIGRSMTIAGAAIVAGFGMAIRTAARFEQSMANTASVAGATAEELKNLSDFAREMGEQSVFSASEAADAMYFLASAGMNTTEIMGALEGTLALAAATASDLAFTSESVAASLSQFGLDADEAGRIANVFAAAISGSQATMDKLSTSMSYVGPMAKSMGMSIEDTVGILTNLYNAGLDGSTAGTALRMAFVKLIEPTEKGTIALNKLGVAILNSDGKMRPFKDIIDDLGVAGMSTADAMAILGVRSGPAMLALVSQGTGAIQEMTDAVTGTDKATEMAAMQIDTFQGAMKLLRSAFEELQITLVRDLMPSIKGLIEKVTEGIKKVSEWMKENPKLTETIVKWGAAIGVLMLVLGPLLMMLPGLVTAIGLLLSPIGLVAAAVVALVLVWKNWDKIVDFVKRVFEKIKGFITVFISDAMNRLTGIIDWIMDKFAELADLPKKMLEWGKKAITGFADGIKDKLSSVTDAVKSVGNKIKDFLGFESPPVEGPLSGSDKWMPNMMIMFGEGISDNLELVYKPIQDLATGMTSIFDTLKTDLGNTIKDIVGYLETNLSDAIYGVLTGAEEIEFTWKSFWEGLKDILINAVAAMIAKLVVLAGFSWLFSLLGLPTSLLGLGRGIASVPSYQQGVDYVPRTGLAVVHEGERITPASQNTYNQQKSYASSINIQPGAIIINTPRFSGRDAKEMLAKIKREAAMQGYKFATA